MQMTLTIIQIILSLTLITVILMQRSGADSLGGMGGQSQPVFSSRTATNAITKFTIIVFLLFALNCIILGKITKNASLSPSKVEQYLDEIAPPSEIELPTPLSKTHHRTTPALKVDTHSSDQEKYPDTTLQIPME